MLMTLNNNDNNRHV